MEDLQVEDFNDPIEHKAEQTADGIKTPLGFSISPTFLGLLK
jgi:hypothetical protein